MLAKCKTIHPHEEQILTKTRLFYILEFLYVKSKMTIKKGNNTNKKLTNKITEIYQALLENKLDLDKKIIEILDLVNDDKNSELTKSRLTTERTKTISSLHEIPLKLISSPSECNYNSQHSDIMQSYNKNKM